MIRLVLDVNVLVSALLSRDGAPAVLLRGWLRGTFELIVSRKLLAELQRVLAYPKIRARIPAADAAAFVALLREQAVQIPDPRTVEALSADPNDDYVIALARAAGAAFIVSGDHHLTDLRDVRPPVVAPAEALRLLGNVS